MVELWIHDYNPIHHALEHPSQMVCTEIAIQISTIVSRNIKYELSFIMAFVTFSNYWFYFVEQKTYHFFPNPAHNKNQSPRD